MDRAPVGLVHQPGYLEAVDRLPFDQGLSDRAQPSLVFPQEAQRPGLLVPQDSARPPRLLPGR